MDRTSRVYSCLFGLATRRIGCFGRREFSVVCFDGRSASYSPRSYVNFCQPKRFGAREKEARTKAQRTLEMKRKRDARKRLPIAQINHEMNISEIVAITGRSAEQVYHATALCEKVEFIKRKHYPLNVTLTGETLTCVIKRLGYRPEFSKSAVSVMPEDRDIYPNPVTSDLSKLRRRPPIVAVMGHVDHGKTTILDALRKTSVAQNEAGGITQSIGAFSVQLANDSTVTFIDTPGHSVFTSMRERGAQATDIALLVVAADDGVMEQTIESINMVRMAETPVVVAINKCDKPDAAPGLVLEDLQNHGIKCEDIGGDVPDVKISALKNLGLEDLVQAIITTAEIHSLKCDPTMQVQGFILESQKQKGRGNVCSVVVKQGTLQVGQVLVAGNSMAKVKSIMDTSGKTIKKLAPGEAGSVMGWKTLPSAGQVMLQADSEARAKDAIRYREKELDILNRDEIWEKVSEKREIERREYENIRDQYGSKLHRRTASYTMAIEKNKISDLRPVLNIIIKADVDGSMEAIMKIVKSYDCNEECALNLVSSGIGQLKLSEFELAKELNAAIFLFNTDVSKEVPPDGEVTILKHSIIYRLVKDLKRKLSERLPQMEKDIVKGEASVLQIFRKGKTVIAGCKVDSGVLDSKAIFTITRDGLTHHRGPISSLRQHATVLSKTTAGNECGIIFENYPDCGIESGDLIRCITVVEEEPETSWQPPGF